MVGLSFSDEQDAAVFYDKMATRDGVETKKKKKTKGNSLNTIIYLYINVFIYLYLFFFLKETSGKKPTRGKLNKAQIGLPSEFR